MITLDTTTLSQTDDETYSAWKNDHVKLIINGNKIRGCLYCNVTKGFAIVAKTDLDGKAIVYDDTIVHEIIFGDITVEKPITQTNLATGETVTFKD